MSDNGNLLGFPTSADAIERIARLRDADGGGTSGGMEARIAKLEGQMEGVRAELAKLSNVPADLARLDERVKHLPSKGFVVTSTSTAVALIGALIVFGDKLRAIVGG